MQLLGTSWESRYTYGIGKIYYVNIQSNHLDIRY